MLKKEFKELTNLMNGLKKEMELEFGSTKITEHFFCGANLNFSVEELIESIDKSDYHSREFFNNISVGKVKDDELGLWYKGQLLSTSEVCSGGKTFLKLLKDKKTGIEKLFIIVENHTLMIEESEDNFTCGYLW